MTEAEIITMEHDLLSHKTKKSRKIVFKDRIKVAKDRYMMHIGSNSGVESSNGSSGSNAHIELANRIHQATKIQNISLSLSKTSNTINTSNNNMSVKEEIDLSSLFSD